MLAMRAMVLITLPTQWPKNMSNLNALQKQIQKSTGDAAKQLESIRQQIIECDDEIEWLNSSPLPLADALANVDAFISESATAPGLRQFFYDRPLNEQPLTVEGKQRDSYPLQVVDGFVAGFKAQEVDLSGVLCGLFPELIRAALLKQVECESPNIEAGPPRAERSKLIAEAKQRRIDLEYQEEAIIDQAERSGLRGFYRREDVNPEIVLMMAA